jgi:MFS family permease
MNRVGISFAAIQLFFISTWTVYVIFLPQLAAQAGIEKRWVIFLLMADQVLFGAMDLAMGLAADRVGRTIGRLGRMIVGMTAISCITFALLPLIAPAASPALFMGVIAVWAITSSALRAPQVALLGKYVPAASVPWMASLLLVGTGVAAAIGPPLTVVLRNVDPRVPFALSSVALLAMVSSVLWAEKHLARGPKPVAVPPRPITGGVLVFYGAVVLLGLGFQVEFALNAGPMYLRFAKPENVQYLLPIFWAGFCVAMFPATRATARFGGIPVMAVGGLVGALGAVLAETAGSLGSLITWQFVAGAAWGAILMSALAAAIAIGRTGREGAATGGLFSLLAVATFARMAIVATQVNNAPGGYPHMLAWLPVAMWGTAGVVLMALQARAAGRASGVQAAA